MLSSQSLNAEIREMLSNRGKRRRLELSCDTEFCMQCMRTRNMSLFPSLDNYAAFCKDAVISLGPMIEVECIQDIILKFMGISPRNEALDKNVVLAVCRGDINGLLNALVYGGKYNIPYEDHLGCFGFDKSLYPSGHFKSRNYSRRGIYAENIRIVLDICLLLLRWNCCLDIPFYLNGTFTSFLTLAVQKLDLKWVETLLNHGVWIDLENLIDYRQIYVSKANLLCLNGLAESVSRPEMFQCLLSKKRYPNYFAHGLSVNITVSACLDLIKIGPVKKDWFEKIDLLFVMMRDFNFVPDTNGKLHSLIRNSEDLFNLLALAKLTDITECSLEPGIDVAVPLVQDRLHYLLRARHDPNAVLNDGSTPLHYAVMNNDDNLAKTLVDYNADPRARDSNGFSPLDTADRLDPETYKFLLSSSSSEEVISLLK